MSTTSICKHICRSLSPDEVTRLLRDSALYTSLWEDGLPALTRSPSPLPSLDKKPSTPTLVPSERLGTPNATTVIHTTTTPNARDVWSSSGNAPDTEDNMRNPPTVTPSDTLSSGVPDSSPDSEYEIDAILQCRKRNGRFQWLVSWKGYGPEFNQWRSIDALDGCLETLVDFHRNRKPRALGPSMKYLESRLKKR
ncbi:hypothetical protein VNI00_017050 [Paramarasmius palmivorus]|uniref:Chromo domain-containing protein n=1 Tax=Paramarasmius palmivorus TaxID=297713 RepID=A0AAW0B929_9AGAR